MPAQTGFHISVSSNGDVAPGDVERAEERLTQAADVVPDQVLHGQLRLSMASTSPTSSTRTRPAKVEGELDVDGRTVRAQVAAPTMQDAIDRFAERLRSRVTEYVGRRRERRTAGQEPEPGQWRRTDMPTDRPEYFDRPPEEREIVRRKSFASPFATLDEAVFDMEALDHDFFLFRNAESGEANVVHRTSDGGYELLEPTPRTGGTEAGTAAGTAAAPIRPSNQVPPAITPHDAVTALNIGNQPFLFFIDADDGEGAVMYRRYDGHYGMITLESV